MEEPMAHFEIPQIVNDYGNKSIEYLGSSDKQYPFIFYTSPTCFRYGALNTKQSYNPFSLGVVSIHT